MLHRLCGPPSIPLKFQPCDRTPRRIAYRVSFDTAGLGTGHIKQSSFRARTTRYLILFAPLAFVPQRQLWSSEPLSPQVFLPISTHFTATPEIPLTSPILKLNSFSCRLRVEPEDFTEDLSKPPTHPLRPIIPNNACPPRITAAAGTKLAGFFYGYRHYLPHRKEFTYQDTSSSTRRCCVRVSPIAQNSPLLPPVGVWTVFQFQCVRAPSQAGYRSSPWWAITPPTS